jgi:hypothetical protein
VKILVVHGSYGCETGCCGHWFEAKNDDGTDAKMPPRKGNSWNDFDLSHPYQGRDDFKTWAEEQIRDRYGDEHVANLDWENSLVLDD